MHEALDTSLRFLPDAKREVLHCPLFGRPGERGTDRSVRLHRRLTCTAFRCHSLGTGIDVASTDLADRLDSTPSFRDAVVLTL